MRIVGGKLKGRSFDPPARFGSRPTTDFAKEGLFNIVSNEWDLEGCAVLDLFAGTGAISFEFASRGANPVYAIEMNSLHATTLRKNVGILGLDKVVQVVRNNVFDFIPLCRMQYDLIFADPPYDLDQLELIPEKIFSANLLKEGGQFILEHPEMYCFDNHPFFIKERKYGNVHFTFFEKKV
ncbi:MAG: 16S rRNA (guanine(966)-N(2))-methyltransferase RsmD [Bacteroidales bacterium]|nr:16S rRNA (guanine(966)-N(2))-methyltransferase RsmD [Bacteroidales bacterium]